MGPREGVGSVLGDISFLLGGNATAKVVALEPVECFELKHDSLERIARDSPSQASKIYRALAKINAQRLISQTQQQNVLYYDKKQLLDPAIKKALDKLFKIKNRPSELPVSLGVINLEQASNLIDFNSISIILKIIKRITF